MNITNKSKFINIRIELMHLMVNIYTFLFMVLRNNTFDL